MWRKGLPAGAVVLALGVLATGTACSRDQGDPSGGTRPGASESARPSVSMSFGQLPSQIGTDRGLLRVVNTGRADLAVGRVGLDWAGYGGRFLQREDDVLKAGQTVDFPVTLPPPDCSDASGAVLGVVETGEVTVRPELDRPGSILLRRNRDLACAEEMVRNRLAVEYAGTWRTTGTGRTTAMVGQLRLSRRDGSDEVRLLGVQGSVLYDLDLPGASTMAPTTSVVRVPLRITPGNRCDEHAHSQATAPFAFGLRLSIGGHVASVPLTPPPDVQARLPALLTRACG